jgi:hypothetical protein
MYGKENENGKPCPYHVPREESGFGLTALTIPNRTRSPVLKGKDNPVQYVQDESAEKDYLEYLYKIIGAHETGGSRKPFAPIVAQQAKVYT